MTRGFSRPKGQINGIRLTLHRFKTNAKLCVSLYLIFRHEMCKNVKIMLPRVPEPQNLNERKLVRGKERRKKGGSGQMITQPRFGADQRDYESIRSPFEQ